MARSFFMILWFHSLHTCLHVSRFYRLSRPIINMISSKMWSGNVSLQVWSSVRTDFLYFSLGLNFELAIPILNEWLCWICKISSTIIKLWFCFYSILNLYKNVRLLLNSDHNWPPEPERLRQLLESTEVTSTGRAGIGGGSKRNTSKYWNWNLYLLTCSQ